MPTALGITAGQAGINTASGIIGQTIGRIFAPRDRQNQLEQQEKLNEQAYDINNRMAEANYAREMRKWNDTNYSAQMEQLNKAGLNPGLLYGMSGGGGATSTAAPGQGVGAGQAESSRQGMGIMPIDIMQIQNMKAQQELIKAQTANVNADTKKKGGETTGINLDNEYKGATLEQRIANVAIEATRLMNEARQSGNTADITGATVEDQINQIKAEAIGAAINNEALRSGISVNKQKIIESAQNILQGWKGLDIKDKEMQIHKFAEELKASYPSMSEVIGTILNRALTSIWGIQGNDKKQNEARDFKIEFK